MSRGAGLPTYSILNETGVVGSGASQLASGNHTHEGGSLTLSEVKADTDIADAISKKHSNTLDHSNANDHAAGDSIAAAITDADTTHSPNGDVLFHALAAKGTSNLALGDLAANAYPGDKGKTAYDHSQVAHAPSGAQVNADITKAEIEAKLTGELTSHTHAGGGGSAFPTGSVFISVVSTDPATLLGYGTWAAIGAGKVLIGLDSGDTSFDTVEETGGSKTVSSSTQTFAGTLSTAVVNHVHVQNYGTPATGNFTTSAVVDASSGGTGASAGTAATAVSTANPTGGAADYTPAGTNTPGAATSVVQPYLVVYMWKRTA